MHHPTVRRLARQDQAQSRDLRSAPNRGDAMIPPRALMMVCMALAAAVPGAGAWAQSERYPQTGIADGLSDTTLPVLGAAVAGLWLIGGEAEHETARRSLDSLIGTGLAVKGLKSLVSSPRPRDPSDDDGFPSGHTALAVCVATVVGEHEPQARPWAYLYAAGVGWSRVKLGAHTWSQVLAGAGIGYVLGRSSAHGRGLLGRAVVPKGPPAMQSLTSPPARPEMVFHLLDVDW